MITFWTRKETTRKLRLNDQYIECFVLGKPISLRVQGPRLVSLLGMVAFYIDTLSFESLYY